MSDESYVFKFTLVNKQAFENLDFESFKSADITFPTMAEEINHALAKMGLPENASHDLYCLTDFETPFSDFEVIGSICDISRNAGIKIYDNSINELNYLAELLDNMTYDEKLVFSAAIEADEHCMYISDLINLAQNTECYNIIEDIYDYEDVTRYFLDERGINISGLGFLTDYIDFYKCGADLCEEEKGILIDSRYLETNHAHFTEVYNGDIFTIPEQYRVMHFECEPDFSDVMIQRSMELALELDSFFRSHDKEYNEKHSAEDVPAHLSDCLLENNLDKIKEMLSDLGQLENDVLPLELAEYEKTFLANVPKKDVELSAAKALAYDLDWFLRAHNSNYAEQHPDKQAQQETLTASLLQGQTIPIKKHLDNILEDGSDDLLTRLSEYEKEFEKPGRNFVHIQSACNSNYKGMIAFVGDDDNVYLGKRENYLFRTEHIPYYDNTDKSFTYISDNKQMYYFLYGEGFTSSQDKMVKNGYLTENDYAEFDRLQKGVLSQFEQTREFTFAGKPFQYLETAEKTVEQNYNQIDGQINNKPPRLDKKPSVKARLLKMKKEQGERNPHKPHHKSPPEL